ncbi:hypothetical protein [Streptomyces hokutonensis]|uniref:hypothetical protein n=1 Tax=Streptomyces hokutonensis TaxID=1306990 RepID=UPI0033F64832
MLPKSVGTAAGLREISDQDLIVVFQALDPTDEIGFGDVVDFRTSAAATAPDLRRRGMSMVSGIRCVVTDPAHSLDRLADVLRQKGRIISMALRGR